MVNIVPTKKVKQVGQKGPGNRITNEIKDMLKAEIPGTEIARQLGVTPTRVYSINNYYKKEIDSYRLSNKQVDVSDYEENVVNILKTNVVRIGNTLKTKDLSKSNVSQLSNSMSVLIDKIRLIEGKSTQNIAAQIIHNLNPDQLSIIQESIMSLKKSILNNE